MPAAELGQRVLYLGWWNEASDALARHGCQTTFVVSASDAQAPGRHGFTGRVVVVPDATRVDDVVSGLAREGIEVGEFEVVCTEYEQCIVPAAVIAQAYRRTGMAVRTAIALRDKLVQKRLVRHAGLAAARCQTVIDTAGLTAATVRTPFVVKPLAGAGTQLTYAVRDARSLRRAAERIAESEQPGPWLVEEFVAGSELHLDGVVRDGTVLFLACNRYLQNLIDIQDGGITGSVALDPDRHHHLYDRAHELVTMSLKALGHGDGVFHLEAFEQDERLVFSECAGRIGGGMIWETTLARFGVDLYDEWARAALGLPTGLSSSRPPDPRPHGWVHLSARPGRVVAIPGVDDLCAQPGVLAAQVSLGCGDTVPDSTLASHFRAARAIMTAESEEAVADGMQSLVRWFRDQVQVQQ